MILQDEFELYLENRVNEKQAGIVKEAMAYSLLMGGKRIRPQLLFAALQDYGIDPKVGFGPAAAIEMIHTYSLIHDDLPAMDNDDLRRGKPSCHKAYGEDMAILAGDGLLTKAFEVVLDNDVTSSQSIALVRYLSQYAGVDGMIYGQELDILGEKKQANLDAIYKIDEYKTAKLLTLPLIFSCILSGHQDDIPTMQKIGYLLGVLFQIQDDILDVTTDAKQLGKSTSDTENHKMTTVSLLGLEKAKDLVKDLKNQLYEAEESLSIDTKTLHELFDYILSRTY